MKKINNYSAQFKVIQKPENENNNNNNIHKQSSFGNNSKKKLSKQNQEFINKISATGFKQFFS